MDFAAYCDPGSPVDVYRALINATAQRHRIPPCALAATVEIESGGRNVFQDDMPRGAGCGVGLCQITAGVSWENVARPTFAGFDLLEPAQNLNVAAQYFLYPAIDAALALRGDPANAAWMQSVQTQILWWAFAAYNGGPEFVRACVRGRVSPDTYDTDQYATRSLAAYARNLQRSAA